jgi:hypothetical protein
MNQFIYDIYEKLKIFIGSSKNDFEHSLIYDKYDYYSFNFNKEFAYYLKDLTGLSASSMLQQHALVQFKHYIESEAPIPQKFNQKSELFIFENHILIDITLELSILFTLADGWHVRSYSEKSTFENIYQFSLELITFHPTIKTLKDLNRIRCMDRYVLFDERIKSLNMNMYTKEECLKDFSIDTSNPLNYNEMTSITAKIFPSDDCRIFNQIFSLINFSAVALNKSLNGTYFNFDFETDNLNKIFANNKHFTHSIYSICFHDFNSSSVWSDSKYISISIIEDPEKYILTYHDTDGKFNTVKFNNLNSLYDYLLALYRDGLLSDLGIKLEDFTKEHLELYQMAYI